MELKAAILNTTSPDWEYEIGQFVCKDKRRFLELMRYFYEDDPRLLQRSTLVILECDKLQPGWINQQIPQMVGTLKKSLATPLKRNILRILQYKSIPKNLWGRTVDQCFNYLGASDEPVAVKVFSMTVLYNLTKELPDISIELKLLIEEQFPLGSGGFRARGRKVLDQLRKDGL